MRTDFLPHAATMGANQADCRVEIDQRLDLDILTKWLGPKEDWLTAHMLIRDKRIHAEAGQWVFEASQFKEWRQRPGSRLWLHGKVGSGKTILCSSIIEYLKAKEPDASSDTYPVMFFYFAFNKSDEQDLASFLISVLYQFCASQGIPKQLQSLYLTYKKLSHARPTVLKPLRSELLKVLLDICQSLQSGGFLIMDAMDEIPHGLQREDFLRFLREVTSHQTLKLSILVTSQSEPDFTNQFRWDLGWKILGLGSSRVDKDIALFVRYELSTATKFSRLSSNDQRRIEDYLVRNADGVFQWVDLILQTLLGPMILRKLQVEEILRSLPNDLKETYDRLLQRIDKSMAPEIALALKWLSLAKRPLYIEEVIEASILDPRSNTTLNTEQRLSATQLLSCLTGLVTLEPQLSSETKIPTETHVLALAHSSIRGYLILKDDNSTPWSYYQFNKNLTDDFIAQCCVEYLSHCYLVSWRKHIYPLAKYADRFWKQHADHNPELLSYLRKKMNDILSPLLYPNDGAAPKLLEYNPDDSDNSFANNSGDLARPPLGILQVAHLSNKNELVHEPLLSPSGFRLVILLPSHTWDDPLECRLQHSSMEDKPFYRALSYVWGAHTFGGMIFVDGVPYLVTANLENALRHLRQGSGGALQTFWIDAISINQSDIEERSHQVALMSTIFQNAVKVTMWLGADFAFSELAMEVLSRFQDIPDSIQSVANGLLSISTATWHALQNLFRRPWFERVWNVPEIAVAKDVEVLCGQRSFPWSVFERIEKAYATHGSELHEYTFNFWQTVELNLERLRSPSRAEFSQSILGSKSLTTTLAIRRRYKLGVPFKLPELVVLMSDHKCVDPRDRLYALQMMLKVDPGNEPPAPDYSMSVHQVYQSFTEYWLNRSGELDLLSYVDSTSVEPHFPSWVPDWGGTLLQSLDQGSLARPFKESYTRLYNATSASTACLRFRTSGGRRTMDLPGIHVGVVEMVGGRATPRPVTTGDETAIRAVEPPLKHSVVLQWRQLMDDPTVQRRYGRQVLEDAFWRTFLADQQFSLFGDPRRLGTQWSKHENIDQMFADWERVAPSYLDNRTFFRSSEGWVGLCSQHARSGDRIVLLRGGRLPFIIRRDPENDQVDGYTLIGEAYVHGIMDGELLERSKRRGMDVNIRLV